MSLKNINLRDSLKIKNKQVKFKIKNMLAEVLLSKVANGAIKTAKLGEYLKGVISSLARK